MSSAASRVILAVAAVALAAPAFAQTRPLDAYLRSDIVRKTVQEAARTPPGQRTPIAIRGLLPIRLPNAFVDFMSASGEPAFRAMLQAIDVQRLNKMLAGAPGSGGTSLVSGVAAPAVLGAAIEYGTILQRTTGTTTVLRGNLLGVARLLVGAEQFQYCPEIDTGSCSAAARHLRRFSGSVAFEDVRTAAAAGSGAVPGSPTSAALLGDDYRVASWGARFDLTPSNNLDDPKYVAAWRSAITQLRADPASAALSAAVAATFGQVVAADEDSFYTNWQEETVALLAGAPSEDAFYDVLEERLLLFAALMAEADDAFARNLAALNRAYMNYFEVRDALIREAHVHKVSLEYTNRRPQGQPTQSNVRLIYSHQPTGAAAIVTLNGAATWYDSAPAGANTAFRDAQFAAQLDRRIVDLSDRGAAVLTLAAYYQWMKEDALLSGLAAPFDTKGHIAVLQGKLSIPLSGVVKVPLSVTWANRRELIKEEDVRGQIGLTIDLDGLFE